ncbi:DLW-39 family protein [uncultured Friedmanniella sp.]
MNWKLLMAVGAAVGGVWWAASRRVRADAAEADLWAEATDPVPRA